MKKSELKQQELIREYVREALLTEIDYTSSAKKLSAGIKKAVGGAKEDIKAVRGKALELGAALKRATKLILSQGAEFLTAGIYKANRDKIDAQYLATLGNIQKEYGASYAKLDDKFKENVDPLVKMGVLYAGPAAALGGVLGMKVASKMQQSGEKLGASPEIKKMFNEYYDTIDGDLENFRNQIKNKKETSKKETSIEGLKKIRESLKASNETLKNAGTGPGTLYHKNLKGIEKIDEILKSAGVNVEQS
jgi:hypothetical protein